MHWYFAHSHKSARFCMVFRLSQQPEILVMFLGRRLNTQKLTMESWTSRELHLEWKLGCDLGYRWNVFSASMRTHWFCPENKEIPAWSMLLPLLALPSGFMVSNVLATEHLLAPSLLAQQWCVPAAGTRAAPLCVPPTCRGSHAYGKSWGASLGCWHDWRHFLVAPTGDV